MPTHIESREALENRDEKEAGESWRKEKSSREWWLDSVFHNSMLGKKEIIGGVRKKTLLVKGRRLQNPFERRRPAP